MIISDVKQHESYKSLLVHVDSHSCQFVPAEPGDKVCCKQLAQASVHDVMDTDENGNETVHPPYNLQCISGSKCT